MGVEVSLRGEDDEVLESFPSSEAVGWLVWAAENLTQEPNVASQIDEHGNTVFNQLEIPKLIQDSERLLERMPKDQRRSAVVDLIEFFRKGNKEGPASLHFRGD